MPLPDPSPRTARRLIPEAGTITRPDGADLDPDVLYEAAHAARAST